MSTADGGVPATGGGNLDRDQALIRLRLMLRIRAFEETAIRALREKLVLGAIHPSIGQEAVAAGLVTALRREDILLSTHRGHGHTLAMMRELLGREGGNCSGKGGSMHIADFEVGMLGANGVVGANIVIATGAAHSVRLKGEPRIVCCIFGDGAAARARALGLAAREADGNDVMGLAQTAQAVFDEVREGGGPRFIHARTYRLSGHTASDPAAYRDDGELEQRRHADPIRRLRALLVLAGVGDELLGAMEGEARAEMDRVLQRARDTPFPEASRALSDVQDVGDPRAEAY